MSSLRKRWHWLRGILANESGRKELILKAFPGAEVNMLPIRRVAIFPECKVVYNRVRKNANSTTMVALNYVTRGEISKRQILSLANAGLGELRQLPEYRFLLITRDPYTRVLSAFLDKFRTEQYINRFGRFDLSPQGFQRFLSWLRAGGLDKDTHWDLQTKSMLLPFDRYSDVIRFEEFDASMRDFMSRIGAQDHIAKLDQMSVFGRRHSTDALLMTSQYYDTKARDVVASLYERDFVELKYPFN